MYFPDFLLPANLADFRAVQLVDFLLYNLRIPANKRIFYYVSYNNKLAYFRPKPKNNQILNHLPTEDVSEWAKNHLTLYYPFKEIVKRTNHLRKNKLAAFLPGF